MPTRNVVLTEQQTALIERLVKSGRYQNASEVLRTGLRLLEQQEAEEKARLAALRDAARVGLDDLEAGRFVSFADGGELASYLAGIAERRLKGSAAE